MRTTSGKSTRCCRSWYVISIFFFPSCLSLAHLFSLFLSLSRSLPFPSLSFLFTHYLPLSLSISLSRFLFLSCCFPPLRDALPSTKGYALSRSHEHAHVCILSCSLSLHNTNFRLTLPPLTNHLTVARDRLSPLSLSILLRVSCLPCNIPCIYLFHALSTKKAHSDVRNGTWASQPNPRAKFGVGDTHMYPV